MIVKPISEGTSMGIDRKKSIVHDEKQLLRAVRRAIHEYNQPALVSPFLSGNEYTVGIVGNLILPIIELDLNSIPGKPKVRDPHIKDMDINYSKPAQFNEKYAFLAAQTSVAHLALGCTQYNRMDFREHDDKIYFLEMNPLPGLNPESSDLPKMARLAGMDYDVLINTILLDSIREYKPKFSDRFDDKRIEYLSSFVESGLSPLEYYGVGVQETGGIYFKLVKAKS